MLSFEASVPLGLGNNNQVKLKTGSGECIAKKYDDRMTSMYTSLKLTEVLAWHPICCVSMKFTLFFFEKFFFLRWLRDDIDI